MPNQASQSFSGRADGCDTVLRFKRFFLASMSHSIACLRFARHSCCGNSTLLPTSTTKRFPNNAISLAHCSDALALFHNRRWFFALLFTALFASLLLWFLSVALLLPIPNLCAFVLWFAFKQQTMPDIVNTSRVSTLAIGYEFSCLFTKENVLFIPFQRASSQQRQRIDMFLIFFCWNSLRFSLDFLRVLNISVR